MWLGLFTLTVTAAIGFVIASAWLQAREWRDRDRRWRVLDAFVDGCRGLSTVACAAFAPSRFVLGQHAISTPGASMVTAKPPEPVMRAAPDPTLLPRRMEHLRIDTDQIARIEPMLFRRLVLRCRQCPSTEQCARDLCRNSTEDPDEDWKDYCMNASLLGMLSSIESFTQRSIAPANRPASLLTEGMRGTGDIRH
jgi:uncharacterized protein DUF6455